MRKKTQRSSRRRMQTRSLSHAIYKHRRMEAAQFAMDKLKQLLGHGRLA